MTRLIQFRNEGKNKTMCSEKIVYIGSESIGSGSSRKEKYPPKE